MSKIFEDRPRLRQVDIKIDKALLTAGNKAQKLQIFIDNAVLQAVLDQAAARVRFVKARKPFAPGCLPLQVGDNLAHRMHADHARVILPAQAPAV